MDVCELGDALWNTPEPGFREVETHRILSEAFRDDGFTVHEFGEFPGFIAGTSETPENSRLLLIADMDALPNPEAADGSYIHSCGHHMQMAVLYGAASALKKKNFPALDQIGFLAVPAEEFIDFDIRNKLKNEGKIEFLSGKLELLNRGFFDKAEYVVSTHAAGVKSPKYINSVLNMSGFKIMNFKFHGRATHAGATPHLGHNAQNSGALFLQACAFLRETFNEAAHIRIHPIMKLLPDQSVNLIPASAIVETYVRAASLEEVNTTVDKLRAAAEGCASSLGCTVEIQTEAGYLPFKADLNLHELARKTAKKMGVDFTEEDFSAASSDVGDISAIKPTIMLGLPGANGMFHNPGFRITDREIAYRFSSEYTAEYLENIFRELIHSS
ncbi:MAG: M20/M25/M40 family metallo-hydrolase [Spirochaetales bacterium]|nr:M20/M25/M40 family metallo-hydrolase [Spirochaetales bacterium]